MGGVLQIAHQDVASKQQLADDSLRTLTQQVNQQQQAQQALQQDMQQQQGATEGSQHKQRQDSKNRHPKQPWHKRRRLTCAVVWGAANMVPQCTVPLRLLKVASLLYVLHESG